VEKSAQIYIYIGRKTDGERALERSSQKTKEPYEEPKRTEHNPFRRAGQRKTLEKDPNTPKAEKNAVY